MIYDCFLFANELDILEIRLNELKDVVDKFVILETDTTMTGLPKPLYFTENKVRFKEFESKIIHNVYQYPTESKDPWDREAASRNMIRNVLNNGVGRVKDEDTIIIADADEITSAVAVQEYTANILRDLGKTLVQKLFYYRLNCFCPSYIWGWSKIVPGRVFNTMSPQEIRYARMPNLRAPGGWHFSFMGSPEAISNKIKAFAHQEYNKPEITDVEYIRKCMDVPKDIFSRPEITLKDVPLDNSFPEYVINNKDRYIKAGLVR